MELLWQFIAEECIDVRITSAMVQKTVDVFGDF